MNKPLLILPLLLVLGVGCSATAPTADGTSSDPNALSVVFGTRNQIMDLTISADGTHALAAGAYGSIKLWDLRSGLLIRTYRGHVESVTGTCFSPDGKHFASASWDGTARIWDLTSSRATLVLDHSKALGGGDSSVSSMLLSSVAYHPNGRELAVGTEYGKVHVWSLPDGKAKHVFRGLSGCVYPLHYRGSLHELHAFTPGRAQDPEHVAWNTETGQEVVSDQGRGEFPPHLTPDGKTLAVNDFSEIKLLDYASREERFSLKLDKGWSYMSMKFSVDGKFLVAGAVDSREFNEDWPVKLDMWNVETGEKVHSFQTKEFYSGYYDRKLSFCFSADGTRILGSGRDSIHIWSLSNFQLLRSIRPRGTWVLASAMTRDGSMLATSANEQIRLWNLKGSTEVKTLRGHTENVNAMALMYDGKRLVSGSKDGVVNVWSTATGNLMKSFVPSGSAVIDICFIGKSRSFLVKDWRGVVSKWNTKGEKSPLVAELPEEASVGLAIYPNGDFALAAAGGLASRINLKTMENEELFRRQGTAMTALAISPDGRVAASAAQRGRFNDFAPTSHLSLIDLETGKKRHELEGHEREVSSLSFHPDGKTLASASYDGLIRLWNTSSGAQLATLDGHSAEVTSVEYSANGERLLSSGQDGRAILWDVKTRTPLMTFLVFDGEDWAMVRPDNYYWASRGALGEIGFRKGLEVAPFEQFDLVYHRPDLVARTLGAGDPKRIEMYASAYKKRIEKMDLGRQVGSIPSEAPHVEIQNVDSLPYTTDLRELTLNLRAFDAGTPLDRINVWINGVPLHGRLGLRVEGNAREVLRTVPIELSPGNNKIQVTALNAAGIESIRQTTQVVYTGPSRAPELHVFAIGVSSYTDSQYDLDYAAKDAKDLAQAFETESGPFAKVHVNLLTDGAAKRGAVLAWRDLLLKSRVEDTVVLFFAGHGILDAELDYYLATADMDFTTPSSRGLAYEDLEALLDGIPARHKLVLIDACHSGEVDKATDVQNLTFNSAEGTITSRGIQVVGETQKTVGLDLSFDLMKELFADLRRGTGAVVISSAGGSEFALESDAWHNGVFTYSVLEGLQSGGADADGDGVVLVSELRDHVVEKVRSLTKGAQTPTARRVNLDLDFQVH